MKIGITGHQRLDDPSAWPWVAEAIGRELDAASPPLIAVTSLAIGADQLLARLVLERGGGVHAILPFPDIDRSFSPEDLAIYRELISKAKVEVLQPGGSDEDAYLAAGRRVVDLSALMLAVWNGQPAKGKGGTADVVKYARSRGVPLVLIDPLARAMRREQSGFEHSV
jgi:hypothetical protein